MSIGSRLTDLRNKKGLTRVQLAEELNIPMTTLRNYEQDQREPGHKFLIEASRYFGVTTDYILENENAPAPEGAEDEHYMKVVSTLNNFLQNMGWLQDGDISEDDRRFILSVAAMLDTYFEKRG